MNNKRVERRKSEFGTVGTGRRKKDKAVMLQIELEAILACEDTLEGRKGRVNLIQQALKDALELSNMVLDEEAA